MEINGKVYRNLEGQVEYLTGKWDDLQNQINDVRSHLTHYIVVDALPVDPEDIDTSAVYLVGPMGTAPDQYYEEWAYVQKADETWMWEKFGDTASVDLSGYLQKDTSTTAYAKAYIKKADGTQDTASMSSTPNQGFIAQWGTAGRLATKDPVNSSDAVNLSYANDHYVVRRTDVTTNPIVYAKAADGSVDSFGLSTVPTAYYLVQRKADSQISVPYTPLSATDATSKDYVDSNCLAKATGVSTYGQAYVKAPDGSQTRYDISIGANAYSLVYRDANGTVSCGTPTADAHAATKKYVDDAVGQLVYTHAITLSFTVNTRAFILNITLLNDDSTAYTSASGTDLLEYLQDGVYSIITNSYRNASYWSVAVCPSDKYHHSDTGIGFILTAGTDGSTIYVDGIDPDYNSAISSVSVTDVVTTW